MNDKTALQLEDIEKETRAFECPCYNAKLQFRARISIASVGLAPTPEQFAKERGTEVRIGAEKQKKLNLLAEHAEILNVAKELGVLTAFNNAIDATSGSKPLDRDVYFLKWLNTSKKQNTPAFALRQCLPPDDAKGDLSLFGFQDISAILADGAFKMFIPRQLVKGEVIETLEVTSNGVQPQKRMDLTYWVRTKYGYIEKSKEFSDELRKHSIGAFQL